MSAAHLYLYPDLLARAEEDAFIGAVLAVLRRAGMTPVLHEDSTAELLRAKARPGYALVRMTEPPHARGLTFRRTYLPKFYRIETHPRRWDWPVAKARFDAATVNPDKAARFLRNRRRRLFGEAEARRLGHVFVPLQGQLLRHRSFQRCAPIEMLEQVLALGRPVIATLHPREVLSRAETNALERLVTHQGLDLRRGGSVEALLGCDFVVTQNSALALQGYFARKPAVLYAGSDFHHIALGPERLREAAEHRPDFAAYLWWFFRDHALDVSRPNAQEVVAEALRGHGWPV